MTWTVWIIVSHTPAATTSGRTVAQNDDFVAIFRAAKVEQNKNFVALSHKICYNITIESKYGAWAGAMGGFWGCV